MRTLNPDSRGTGRRVGRGREVAPPSRARTGPLAAEQSASAPPGLTGPRKAREKPAQPIRPQGPSPGRPNYPSPTGK